MSDFKTVIPTQKLPDPYKHVNYTMGLVLGVDEFEQEEVYFIEKNRLHNRALHGYGTVCGLHVSIRNNANGPEVVVSSGLAVNSQGQEIRVPSAQCARLNAWLAGHQREVLNQFGSPPGGNPPESLSLYVILCYRECETDMVPIPGEPCRPQEDSMAPSRVADDFELSLRLNPPAQIEEEVVRRFGELLGRIEITAESETFLTQDELENLVRDLARPFGSPPGFPSEIGSPPSASLHLHPDEACDILHAAFRVWVTEARPVLLEAGKNCASGPPDEPCVLLARLDFDVSDSWQVNSPVLINEDDRPVLLHTRLLQEWLLCGRLGRTTAGVSDHGALEGLGDDDHLQYFNTARGDARYALINHTHTLDNLSDVNAPLPQNGQVLTRQGNQWVAATLPSGVTDHGALTGLGDDDHPQYLLVNGTRPLTGNLGAGNNRITNLAPAAANGDAVPFQQAIKVNDPAGGDLGSTYPNPTVTRLQGRPVANILPQTSQVLTWNGSQWVPGTPQAVSGNFVRVPTPAIRIGPYAIVAAGFFDGDTGQPRAPFYNNLRVTLLPNSPGDYLLTFDNYQLPSGRHMYIVKGTVQDSPERGLLRATFEFVRFDERGIIVRILHTNNEPIKSLGFMVEISAFGEIDRLLQ